MEELSVNWWAIIVAAVVKLVIGSLWYSPLLMAKPWQAAMGLSPEDLSPEKMKAGLARAIPLDFIANLVMAYILARFVGHYGATTIAAGALVGFMAWLGFVATVTLASIIYEQRPFSLYLINNAYLLVTIVIMGAIIAVWQGAPVPAAAPSV